MNLEILYEDDNFLAINKPAGLLVHGIKGTYEKTEPDLVDWIIENRPEIRNVGDARPHNGAPEADRPGIVHRLDRETSGVMLIAKNQDYFEYLKHLFQTKDIQKTYLTLVRGRLEGKGVIDKPIGIKDGSVKRTVFTAKAKWVRAAVTEYRVKKHLTREVNGEPEEFTLVEVSPKTGRTHQIRVHMASIGHPVVGDKLYGPKDNSLGLDRHFLHAESIEFTTESGKRITLSAPLPEELQKIIGS